MENPKINLPLILSRKRSNIVTEGAFYTSQNFRKFRPINTWNASARLGIYRSKWTNSRGWSPLTGWSSPIKNYHSICETNPSNRKWTLRSSRKLWALSIQPKLPAGIFGNLQWRKGQHRHLFSKKFSRNFPFHSTLLAEVLEFSVEWFVLRKIQKFPEFLETFPVNF